MKNNSALRIIHLILMITLIISSGFTTVMFFGGFDVAVAGKERLEVLLNGFSTMVVMVMLITGVLYLVRGYQKNAAAYYKAFLVLLVIVTFMVTLLDILYTEMNVLIIIKNFLYIAKIILLLSLAFWKDLGRRKTWMLFNIVLMLDFAVLIVMLINMMQNGFDFALMGIISALVADATIALAIRGKFVDKDSRGSR